MRSFIWEGAGAEYRTRTRGERESKRMLRKQEGVSAQVWKIIEAGRELLKGRSSPKPIEVELSTSGCDPSEIT